MATADPSAGEETLPALSVQDYKLYNKLAEHMEYFHNHFRHSWTLLYTACEENHRPQGMSIRQFLQIGLQLISHLETHHSIEEHYVFPNLAKKMPKFRQKDHLINQHKQIHKGLEEMEKYLDGCRSGETELRLEELKKVRDGFGKVLWDHLDDEVNELKGENMRKFWTKEEMRGVQL
jgi:hemerythrin-like domain-containing protein